MVTKGAVFALAFAAAVDPATARPNGNAHHAHVNPYSAAASSAQMPLPMLPPGSGVASGVGVPPPDHPLPFEASSHGSLTILSFNLA